LLLFLVSFHGRIQFLAFSAFRSIFLSFSLSIDLSISLEAKVALQ